MPLCEKCVKGVVHEGTPEGELNDEHFPCSITNSPIAGKWEKIGGVDCYVTAPPQGEYAEDTVVLFLSDLFGPQLLNNQASFWAFPYPIN